MSAQLVSPDPSLAWVGGLRPMVLPQIAEKPLVSVLVGNYNYARYVGQAIESVLAQDYGNFEVCICDDGSTDDSLAVIEQYAARDRRVKFVSQVNGGHSAALNAAWGMACGEVVALLDADDTWFPQKLRRVVSALRAGGAGLVAHRLKLVWDDLSAVKPEWTWPVEDGWLAEKLLKPPGVVSLSACSGLALRREVAERVFPLDLRFRAHADAVIAERAALLTEAVGIPEPLGCYRVHRGNTTGLSLPRTSQVARREVALLDARLDDRRQFISAQFGVSVDFPWKLGEGVRLAEQLLLGEQPGEALLRQAGLTSRMRSVLWRLLFILPAPLAVRLLGLRSPDRNWKLWLGALLRLMCGRPGGRRKGDSA